MNKGIFRVLSIKSFLFLWLSEIFTQIPTNMLNFVLIIEVFRLANSNTAVSGIVLTFILPAVFFGILAGVYVDRLNKKHVLVATNLLRALLLFLMVVFFNNLLMLFVLSFITFTVTQFFIPAETPIIPQVVDKAHVLAANALFGTAIYVSLLLAYGLSSPFYFVFGPQYVFASLAVLFLLGALFVTFIKTKEKPEKIGQVTSSSIMVEIRHTARLIKNTQEVFRSLMLLTFFQVLILLIAVIGPGYAKQILHIPVDSFPLALVTPSAIGMVLGALIIGHFLENTPREKVATIGLFIIGIATFFLPFGNSIASREIVRDLNTILPSLLDITVLHFMVFLAFVLGVGGAFIFVPSNAILQERTSDELRGKIYGFLNSLVGVLSIIPIIIVGGLADILGVGTVLTGLSIIILIIGIFRVVFL